MMLAAMIASGALAGTGLTLMLRGAIGSTPPLAAVVADLHRPRLGEVNGSNHEAVVAYLAGRPTSTRAADLAVCGRSVDEYVQQRFIWALAGAAPALAFLLLPNSSLGALTTPVLLGAVPVGAVAGWMYARLDLRSDADKARREIRHALAAYLELVTILMAGGAGVETALFDAAGTGRGKAFRHIRSALSAAQARREPPWALLGELGQQLGVRELEELHASMTLAGGGAQVRDSLVAKAAGIRGRDLAQTETEAQSRSETMVLPVALMFAGFLVLIGYPALAALSTP